MTSPKKIAAVRIARSLRPAEVAVNEAPLEAQDAVDYVGAATAKVFGAMSDIKKAHGELRGVGMRHQVLGAGDIFETPGHDDPRGEAEILPLTVAA